MDSIERRRDSRLDPVFSLNNLLRTRAERLACAIAAVGTEDGLVMAASQPGRIADEAVARASLAVRSLWSGPALVTRRVDIDGVALLLTLVTQRDPGEPALADLADRVRSIMRERRATALATTTAARLAS